MPQYHLKLHECDGSVTDLAANVEAGDLTAIRMVAVGMAREIMAAEIKKGCLCLSCWIVISDRSSRNLMTLHFGEAVQMMSHPSCESADRLAQAGET